jgi:membrane associated rhomboid family serine protease
MGFLEVPAETWFSQAKLLLEFIAVLWVIAIVDIGCLGSALRNAVIQRPRSLGGLFYYPFPRVLFHSSWDHLISNSLYCLLFGGVIVLLDPTQLWMVTIVTAVLSGIGMWLVARGPSCGSSGVIFGYFGFIVTDAVLTKNLSSAGILAWLIFSFLFGTKMFYGGEDWEKNTNTASVKRAMWYAGKTLWGVLPGENDRIAWEAHLMGFLSGAFAAQYKTALTPWINQFIRWLQGF